jgi:hypothetical protein
MVPLFIVPYMPNLMIKVNASSLPKGLQERLVILAMNTWNRMFICVLYTHHNIMHDSIVHCTIYAQFNDQSEWMPHSCLKCLEERLVILAINAWNRMFICVLYTPHNKCMIPLFIVPYMPNLMIKYKSSLVKSNVNIIQRKCYTLFSYPLHTWHLLEFDSQ